MKIFSLFSTNKQTVDWSYASQGKIWRMLFSDGGHIVGENRNEHTKEASFFCLEERTGKLLWDGLTLEEPWWVGMEAVQKNVLLLHTFAKPDLPEHRGILAYDLTSAQPIWHNKELTFWFGYENSVYAYKTMFERRRGYSLDLHSGEIIQEFTESLDELQTVRELSMHERRQDDYRFPEVLNLANADVRTSEAVKKTVGNRRIHGEIEFVRDREYLLFNYHAEEKGSTEDAVSLENRLEIIEVERNQRVYSDLLARGAKAPVPDSFFVKGDVVYFIKDSSILAALRLWKS